jgi:hypothetical protein
MQNSTTNTAAILKLTLAILAGGTVTREGVTKRVLVETPNSGDWYILTMTDITPRQRQFTARREDAKTPHVITGEEFSRWANRAAVGA